MNWSPVSWDIPMFVKVPVVALMVCAVLAVVIGGFGLFINWIYVSFGDNAAAGTLLGSLGFGIVCLFTWAVLD